MFLDAAGESGQSVRGRLSLNFSRGSRQNSEEMSSRAYPEIAWPGSSPAVFSCELVMRLTTLGAFHHYIRFSVQTTTKHL